MAVKKPDVGITKDEPIRSSWKLLESRLATPWMPWVDEPTKELAHKIVPMLLKSIGAEPRRKAAMAEEDWLRALIEKIDEDRRESERRIDDKIARIEHFIERAVDSLEATRREIANSMEATRREIANSMEATRREMQEQNQRTNARMDQVYVHCQQLLSNIRWASIGTFIAVAALAVTAIVAILKQ